MEMEKIVKELEQSKERIAELTKKYDVKDAGQIKDAVHKDEVKKMIEDSSKKITDMLEEQKKEAKKSKMPPMMGSVEGETFGTFMLKVKRNDPSLTKVLNEGTNSDGGHLVPEGFSNIVIGELNDPASILPKTTPFPHGQMDGFTKNLPKWLTDMSVTWVAEQGVKAVSNPTFENKQSILKVLAVIVTATDELRDDNIVGMDRLLAEKVGENTDFEIERVILVGDVSGLSDPFNGITNTSGIKEVQMAGEVLDYVDLVKIQLNPNVLMKYRRNAEWYFNTTVWQKIMLLVDASNRPLWSLQPINNSISLGLLGAPVNLSDAISNTLGDSSNTTKIIYGNYKNVYVGFKEGDSGLNVSFSQQAIVSTGTDVTTNLWTQNMSGWRFTLRKSIVVGNPEAFSVGDEIK